MGIMDMLGSSADVAAGGVRTRGEGGISLFDIPALAAALRDRSKSELCRPASVLFPHL